MTVLLVAQLVAALAVGIGYTLPGVVSRERPQVLGVVTLVLVGFGIAHALRMVGGRYPSSLSLLAVAVLFAYAGAAFAIGVRYFREGAKSRADSASSRKKEPGSGPGSRLRFGVVCD